MDKIEGKASYVGRTDYNIQDVYIEKGSKKQMLLTLKHELMHIWLYENGYTDQDNGCFSYEELCEFTALSNDFINRIVQSVKFFSHANGELY